MTKRVVLMASIILTIISIIYLKCKFEDKLCFFSIIISFDLLYSYNYVCNIIDAKRKFKEIILFIPCIGNILSIVIANISSETRYWYPTLVCCLIIYSNY